MIRQLGTRSIRESTDKKKKLDICYNLSNIHRSVVSKIITLDSFILFFLLLSFFFSPRSLHANSVIVMCTPSVGVIKNRAVLVVICDFNRS